MSTQRTHFFYFYAIVACVFFFFTLLFSVACVLVLVSFFVWTERVNKTPCLFFPLSLSLSFLYHDCICICLLIVLFSTPYSSLADTTHSIQTHLQALLRAHLFHCIHEIFSSLPHTRFVLDFNLVTKRLRTSEEHCCCMVKRITKKKTEQKKKRIFFCLNDSEFLLWEKNYFVSEKIFHFVFDGFCFE